MSLRVRMPEQKIERLPRWSRDRRTMLPVMPMLLLMMTQVRALRTKRVDWQQRPKKGLLLPAMQTQTSQLQPRSWAVLAWSVQPQSC